MTLHLRRFRRPLFASTLVATLGLGIPAALALSDAPDRPRLEPVGATTTPTSTTAPGSPRPSSPSVGAVDVDDATEDLRGPCDEAEHADDPRCATAPDRVGDDDANRDDDHRDEDDSDNRDDDDRDDDSDDRDDDEDEDRSGSNSGRG